MEAEESQALFRLGSLDQGYQGGSRYLDKDFIINYLALALVMYLFLGWRG